MNKPLPLVQVTSILLLTIYVALIVGCSSPEDRAAEFMHKASKLHAEGDLVKAQLEVRNVIQLRPNYTEAWVLWGKIQVAQENWKGALSSFEKALSIDEYNLPSLLMRSNIFLSAGLMDKAQRDLERALAIAPNDSEVMLQQARSAAVKEDNELAISLAGNSLARDPDNSKTRILLAFLLNKTGDADQAIKLLNEGIERNPKTVETKKALAILYRERGDSAGELKLLNDLAMAKGGNDIEATYHYASALSHYSRPDEAEQVLRRLLAKQEVQDRQRTALTLIALFEKTQMPSQAEENIKSLIVELNNAPELVLRLAKFQHRHGKMDEAKNIYHKMIERFGNDHPGHEARKGLASIHVLEQDYESAKVLINEVLGISSRDYDALTTRAMLAVHENRFSDAVSDLRLLSQDKPTDPVISEKLTRAYLAQGKADLAIDQLNRFISMAPTEQRGYTALNELYARLGQQEKARNVLLQLLEVSANNPVALTRLVYLESKQKNYAKAINYARQLRNSLPDQPQGHYLLGQINQISGNHHQAIDAFSKAISLKSDWIEPVTARMRSRLALGEDLLARTELLYLLESNPKNFALHNLMGELQRKSGELEKALSSFEQAIELNRKWPIPYLNSADLKIKLGKEGEALQLLEVARKNTNVSKLFPLEMDKLYKRAEKVTATNKM